MIHFEQDSETSKKYYIYENGIKKIELNLIQSSLTNKFGIITDYISKISKRYGIGFDSWLINMLESILKNEDEKFDIINENIQKLIYFSDSYIDDLGVDYSEFVDYTKKKKNSILFVESEIEDIIKLSGRLKIYSLIFNSENFKLMDPLHKRIYNALVSDVVSGELINKLFDMVKIRTYKYNITDKDMWIYIKKVKSMSIDDHIIEVFNLIMNKIIVLCEPDRNPVVYFSTVIDESTKWVLKGIYGDVIIYDDTISTQDAYSTSGINNLKTAFYNDTLARLKIVAMREVNNMTTQSVIFNDNLLDFESNVVSLRERIENDVKCISPIVECITYPILSRIVNIPYKHFVTLGPEQAAYLSVLTYGLMKKVFGNKYSNIIDLLLSYPAEQTSLITTYQIKDSKNLETSNDKRFFTIRNKIYQQDIFKYFIGSTSRCKFNSIITGEHIMNKSSATIENELISFLTEFFDGSFVREIHKMTLILNEML